MSIFEGTRFLWSAKLGKPLPFPFGRFRSPKKGSKSRFYLEGASPTRPSCFRSCRVWCLLFVVLTGNHERGTLSPAILGGPPPEQASTGRLVLRPSPLARRVFPRVFSPRFFFPATEVYEWTKGEKAGAFLQKWVMDRKLTSRVEDLTPSAWFKQKNGAWQKVWGDGGRGRTGFFLPAIFFGEGGGGGGVFLVSIVFFRFLCGRPFLWLGDPPKFSGASSGRAAGVPCQVFQKWQQKQQEFRQKQQKKAQEKAQKEAKKAQAAKLAEMKAAAEKAKKEAEKAEKDEEMEAKEEEEDSLGELMH